MLLGLYGDSRSGKDTVARYLYYEYEFEWRSFADPLRQILLNINPILEQTDQEGKFYLDEFVQDGGWDDVKKHYPYVVDMMIALGQSVRDLIDEDAWIKALFKTPVPANLVISDVRQLNEYQAILERGGEVWRIIRPDTTKRGMDGLLDNDLFPVVIYNTKTVQELYDLVDVEVENLSNRRS